MELRFELVEAGELIELQLVLVQLGHQELVQLVELRPRGPAEWRTGREAEWRRSSWTPRCRSSRPGSPW